MRSVSVLCIFGLAAAFATPAQTPLGTAFSYQGRLENAGSPASGVHDLRFRLYDASIGGVQVGATVCFNNVTVTDGLFTVSLDFGAQFTGQERFLEIDVRVDSGRDCTNSAAFTVLSPRQPLTATPYALQTRGLFVDDFGRVGIGTTTPVALLNIDGGLILDDILDEDVAFYTGNFYIRNGGNEDPAYHYQSDPEQHEFFVGGGSAMTITPTGHVGIGTSAPIARLDARTASPSGVGVYGAASSAIGANFGVYGATASTSGQGVTGTALATSGTTYAGRFDNASTEGRGVYGRAAATTGFTYGGRFESASMNGRGVYGEATATSGETYGGRFHSASIAGRGVYGVASASTGATYGVWGQSASSSGRGIYGEASAATGSTSGVYGESASTGGTGVKGVSTAGAVGVKGEGGYGVYGESNTTGGYGVVGLASAATGTTYGVYGQSNASGAGVYGENTFGVGVLGTGDTGVYGTGQFGLVGRTDSGVYGATGVYGESTATAGTNYGGHFRNESTDGYGVFGYAGADTGSAIGVHGVSHSATGRGISGLAAANTGTNYGVYGTTDSPAGYGVWAGGRLGASGTKSFRIDHPDDPTNKYLLHYCAESPEVINFYSETVTLDERGEAVVALPPYFAKINTRPRYQLTAVGAPMPMLHVAEKISAAALSAGAKAEPGEVAPPCSFRIAGGLPGGEVSWEVKAVRNDRWVQQRGAPVEVEKQDLERGTYQHPELYGQPKEKGMNFDAERERAS